MNDYLKKLGELARIDEPIRETYYKGNERVDDKANAMSKFNQL